MSFKHSIPMSNIEMQLYLDSQEITGDAVIG